MKGAIKGVFTTCVKAAIEVVCAPLFGLLKVCHVLCTPNNRASVYSVALFEATYIGCICLVIGVFFTVSVAVCVWCCNFGVLQQVCFHYQCLCVRCYSLGPRPMWSVPGFHRMASTWSPALSMASSKFGTSLPARSGRTYVTKHR